MVTCHCSLCRLVPRCGVLEVQAARDQVLDWHGLQVPLSAETWLQMQTLVDYQQTRRKPKSCCFDEKYPFRQEGWKFQCWSSFLGLRIFGSFFWFEIYWSSFLVRGIIFGGVLFGCLLMVKSMDFLRSRSGHEADTFVYRKFSVTFLDKVFLIYIIILSL